MDDFLLTRVEARRIHVFGRPDIGLGDFPPANVLQKTDVIHGAQTGVILGAALGALRAAVFAIFPPGDASLPMVTVLIGSLLDVLFGFGRRAWWAQQFPTHD